MSRVILRQHDGRLAVFSTIVDAFTYVDATPEEVAEYEVQKAYDLTYEHRPYWSAEYQAADAARCKAAEECMRLRLHHADLAGRVGLTPQAVLYLCRRLNPAYDPGAKYFVLAAAA